MAKYLIIILVLSFAFLPCSQVKAFDDWSDQDYIMHGVFSSLHMVDMLQTMKIARNADEYTERNPILGNNPNQTQVVVYFASTWMVQTAFVHVLPSYMRPYAQAVMIAVPVGAIANNFSVGLGFGF
jgi:hypothetical protein